MSTALQEIARKAKGALSLSGVFHSDCKRCVLGSNSTIISRVKFYAEYPIAYCRFMAVAFKAEWRMESNT